MSYTLAATSITLTSNAFGVSPLSESFNSVDPIYASYPISQANLLTYTTIAVPNGVCSSSGNSVITCSILDDSIV